MSKHMSKPTCLNTYLNSRLHTFLTTCLTTCANEGIPAAHVRRAVRPLGKAFSVASTDMPAHLSRHMPMHKSTHTSVRMSVHMCSRMCIRLLVWGGGMFQRSVAHWLGQHARLVSLVRPACQTGPGSRAACCQHDQCAGDAARSHGRRALGRARPFFIIWISRSTPTANADFGPAAVSEGV